MSGGYIGRLAPSPTGLLHLGHARTFWIAYSRARAANGKLFLRNEDLDPHRSREEYAQAAHEDLHWLGVRWDGELQQSTRLAAYRQAFQQLLRQGAVYPCTCSRTELHQALQAPHEESDDEPVYTGRCRPSTESGNNEDLAWLFTTRNYRFRVPDGDPITFVDGHCGSQSFLAGCSAGADFGDFLVWRRDGLPSYQLACVVDDGFQRVTEVVRGRDLLKSTARQMLLQHALSLPTPRYFHCDLLRDEQGIRLAKRHDALSLRTLRERGMTPEQVRAMF